MKKNICGQKLKQARTNRGMVMAEVVAAMAVDHGITMDASVYGRIERHGRQLADFELLALSKIYNVPVEWLMSAIIEDEEHSDNLLDLEVEASRRADNKSFGESD